MSTQEQRDELRRKIEESERRQDERSYADMAREATDTATEFVKEHPILTVSVVALVGLAIGSRTTRGRELTGRAVGFADHLVDLGMAYAGGMATKVGDVTRHSGDRLLISAMTLPSAAVRRAAMHAISPNARSRQPITRAARPRARRAAVIAISRLACRTDH